MKKIFSRKAFQIISSAILFAILFILFHYTKLATFHGKSDAPIIVGIFGLVALLISYILNLKALTITATFGYIIAFILGVCLETDGIVPGDKLTHQLWLVWLISYWIFIGVGIVYDFLRKIKENHQKGATRSKSVVLYFGLLIGVFIVIGSIFVYITRSLTMNEVLHHKPRFSGVVVEINDDTSILVKANENDPIIKSSDLISVSLDVKMKDVSVRGRDFDIGDEVTVYYDGTIEESYPAQLNKVYAIFHKSSSE